MKPSAPILSLAKPPEPSTKAEMLEKLEAVRKRIEANDCDGMLIITATPGEFWQYEFAGRYSATHMIGRLEIVKTEMTGDYLKGVCEA